MKKILTIAILAMLVLTSCRGIRKFGCPNHLFAAIKMYNRSSRMMDGRKSCCRVCSSIIGKEFYKNKSKKNG
jgi:hypothetical protein